MLFHDVVGRALRGQEHDAEEVLARALPRCHGLRMSCVSRLLIALKNGGGALLIERQDDAKPVLLFQTLGLIFAVKTWAELQHSLDAVGFMLRHDEVPVVEYQTRTTVELPSYLEACPTFPQTAMHCVVRDAHRCSAVVSEVTHPTLLQAAMHCV